MSHSVQSARPTDIDGWVMQEYCSPGTCTQAAKGMR
eukprot:CAMPEP_0204585416 /NCGR_PEP_ID=MMETSP0661-20131031/46913_1 /ASSEMBLY_ACC=CAM_ASM_000606 /TAXON_ID=109239 /ORGANISM="Alexandrium margalefi, Strain AMGDE01CS-322" /LENGTH=35 /DNA_ID= /DNA_START= /DNA_END= /DNA_ORIENTATION=